MRSFMTGSRVYGVPKDESDFDLVILMDREEAVKLLYFSDNNGEKQDNYTEMKSLPMRFGKLNIIAVFTEADMAVWKLGTKQLVQENNVSRDRAIEVFSELRKRFA